MVLVLVVVAADIQHNARGVVVAVVVQDRIPIAGTPTTGGIAPNFDRRRRLTPAVFRSFVILFCVGLPYAKGAAAPSALPFRGVFGDGTRRSRPRSRRRRSRRGRTRRGPGSGRSSRRHTAQRPRRCSCSSRPGPDTHSRNTDYWRDSPKFRPPAPTDAGGLSLFCDIVLCRTALCKGGCGPLCTPL